VNATVTLLSPPVTELRVGAAGVVAEEYLTRFDPSTIQNPFVTARIPDGASARLRAVEADEVAISIAITTLEVLDEIKTVEPSEVTS
jgi:hypothetical protein